jgi:hypothetical protein
MEASFTPTHGGLYQSRSQSQSCVSLCLIQISCIHLLRSNNPTIAKDLKRVATNGFLSDLLLLQLLQPFHPFSVLSLMWMSVTELSSLLMGLQGIY